MNSVVARPLKRVKHEIFALALVAAVPLAIISAFPFDAFFSRPAPNGDEMRLTCAFVALTDDEERAALSRARTSWQVNALGERHKYVEISTSELPPAPVRPVMTERPSRPVAMAATEYIPDVLPPTVAAPAPAKIKLEADTTSFGKAAFSREELLKID